MEAPPQILCRVTLTRKLAKKESSRRKMQQTPQKKIATKQKRTKKSIKNVPLLAHWASLGQISVTLGSLLAAFRALLGGLGALLAALGALLGRSWGVLDASWVPLGPLGRNLEKS